MQLPPPHQTQKGPWPGYSPLTDLVHKTQCHAPKTPPSYLQDNSNATTYNTHSVVRGHLWVPTPWNNEYLSGEIFWESLAVDIWTWTMVIIDTKVVMCSNGKLDALWSVRKSEIQPDWVSMMLATGTSIYNIAKLSIILSSRWSIDGSSLNGSMDHLRSTKLRNRVRATHLPTATLHH